VPTRFARFVNGQRLAEAEVPRLAPEALRRAVVEVCAGGARLVALFARPLAAGDLRIYAVLADDYDGVLAAAATDLPAADPRYPALTPDLPEAQAFERELHDLHGVVPEGHPWLKPLRREEGYPFFRVEGEEVHEVAVGPVHAGIIEPGHFRFQCHGEEVIHLEIQLGYQRRGVEAVLERPGLKPARAALTAETIAGDSSVAHALAHATALEGLAGVESPARAQVLRAVALELERLANHTGDLGGLATDIGYLPGASFFGRVRGAFLNLTEELCGNRYGRSLVRPGGVLFDLEPARLEAVRARVERAGAELRELLDLFFETPSVVARLERTGAVTRETAEDVGLVGPPARAAGCDRDVRHDHPTGAYRFIHLPVALGETGDVHARALVRRFEAERSLAFLGDELARLPEGPVRRDCAPPAPGSLVVAMTEGWRGETVHAVVTGERGETLRYKVVDPSFHNWFGLAMALRGEAISDFPLCNKSFNLSYAGHDL
jgi:Ni,Fe-hydrogenase III large subunit